MTPEQHRLMMDCLLRQKTERPLAALFRNFTYGNLAALGAFLGFLMMERMPSPLEWLKMLIVAVFFFTSGWVADRLWLQIFGRTSKKPFSAVAYAGRLPFFFCLSGIFSILPMLWMGMIEGKQTIHIFLLGGLLQIACQVPLQWFLFNRLRKLALPQL